MTEIILITREGKMKAKPFLVNDVASAIAEQKENTNSLSEEATNKDSQVAEDVNADN